MSHNDYEKEPIPGLPALLPDGENIVWQGAPSKTAFLLNVLKIRLVCAYFTILILWNISSAIYDGSRFIDVAISAIWTLALGSVVFALAFWFAKAVQRTTVYTITNKRVVMRFGVALPITFNYPFSQILSADVHRLENNSGTIALTLKEHTKISWMVLWPHARPWKLAKPQPAFRTIEDVSKVADLLAHGLNAVHGVQTTRIVRTSEPAKSGSSADNPVRHATLESV